MTEQPRKTDHERVLLAGRADTSREGARTLSTPLLRLWQSLHRAPRFSPGDRQRLAAALYID